MYAIERVILAYNTSMIFSVFACVLGFILGSFINVVILRFNSGKTITGRSQCFSCGKKLHWYELIPVISFVWLRGRCSQCKSEISIQYPLVELSSGMIFLILYAKFFPSGIFGSFLMYNLAFFILSAILWLSLVIIFVYDMRHKIIPDLFSVLFFLSALSISSLATYVDGNYRLILNHGIAALVLGTFFFLLWFFSNGKAMGFGDVKLSLGIGMYLGIASGLSAIAYAFWIGALYAIGKIGYQKIKIMGTNQLSSGEIALTMKSEVPFAPFLIIGTWLAFLLGSDIFHVSFFLNG